MNRVNSIVKGRKWQKGAFLLFTLTLIVLVLTNVYGFPKYFGQEINESVDRTELRLRGDFLVGESTSILHAFMCWDGLIKGTTIQAITGFVCPDETVITSTSTFDFNADIAELTADKVSTTTYNNDFAGKTYDAFVSTAGDTISGDLNVSGYNVTATSFTCADGTVMTSTSTFEPRRDIKSYDVIIATGSWGGEIIWGYQPVFSISYSSITAKTQDGGSDWVLGILYDDFNTTDSTSITSGTITVSSGTYCGASGFNKQDMPILKQQYIRVDTAGDKPAQVHFEYEIQ